MLQQRRFVIEYILNNSPESIDALADSLTAYEDDINYSIDKSAAPVAPANVSDIRIMGIYPANSSGMRDGIIWTRWVH